MKLLELFKNEPYPLNWRRPDLVNARTADGRRIVINFDNVSDKGNEIISIAFDVGNTFDITGLGDAYRILTTVVTAIREYIAMNHPHFIVFSAEEPSRASLYQAMIKRFQGYTQIPISSAPDQIRDDIAGISSGNVFVLRRTGK